MMRDNAYYGIPTSAFKRTAWAVRRSFVGRTLSPFIAQSVYRFLQTSPTSFLASERLLRFGDRVQIWAVLDPRRGNIQIQFGPLKGLWVENDPSPYFPTFRVLGIEEVMNQIFFERLLRAGDTVYDVGANVGIHTLLFSRLVGPKGKVYAFEPFLQNLDRLKANLDLNKIENVEVIASAVSQRSGRQRFLPGPDVSQGKLADDSNVANQPGALEVPTVSLDDFVAAPGRRLPSLIKLDIEGGEANALEGSRATLQQAKPMIVCEVHGEAAGEGVRSVLRQCNYGLFLIERGLKAADPTEKLPDWCHSFAYHRDRELPTAVRL